jgi:hypothetical protein
VGGSSLEGSVGVGNGTASVVVEMALDVAADNTTESTDKVVDLAGRSATDSVSDTNTVNTLLVNSLVKAEKVDKVTSERVLGGESDLLALTKDNQSVR